MKYTAEEVRDYADACRLAHKGPVIADMLTELAERIKVDESAAPVGFVMEATATRHKFGLLTQDLPPGAELFTHPPAQTAQHPDDVAVDAFAEAMKAKLAEARAKGRGGWQDKDDCPQQRLSDMLRVHVEKGDPRDVANFCMFLHQRGEAILPVEPAAQGEATLLDRAKRLFANYIANLQPGVTTCNDWDALVDSAKLHWVLTAERLAAQPAQSVDVEAIREVIESHINEAKKLRHDPESQDYLYEQADKLTAALQEKGNG